MNFLSHYYFNRYKHDPELVLGCVFPDLLKNADKSIRIHPERYELQFLGNPRLQSLYTGWQHHVEVDRWFHNHPFFYDHTHQLRLTLTPLLEGTPVRASFLSHIALELLLDHLLLRDEIVDEEAFYLQLESVDRASADKFMRLCGLEDTRFFMKFFDAFNRARYIGRYRQVEQITHALLNICRRVWDFRLPEDQASLLAGTLQTYTDQSLGQYMAVFDEMDNFP